MTYAGARGETAQQMADTLDFILPQNRLHPAFNSLDLQLGRRGEGAKGKDGEGFRLNIVNAVLSFFYNTFPCQVGIEKGCAPSSFP